MSRASLEAELAVLADASPAQLREQWLEVTRRPLPRVSPGLLRLALAWELQARSRGGLPRRVSQKLAQIASAKTSTREVQPGMRLVREWQGKVHVVTISEDGVIQWNDRAWKSLSEVARTITGTRWSGPAFFGLKAKTGRAA
ncbi:Protein of unknown function (DUF2924) [Novosphingobium kunmingense]|uniref:DUF2924 family protein n=1 Tax=Novosphingobium kunmingense TaxID=1211806 RepID=A0A2N0H353_9SPHN|nr:DUF2924 domain-containing protein [Novosphingobium kunmingense]PKB13364.1 Protein of unknown function (DUF2924) [Novosphingobium kunmingense]